MKDDADDDRKSDFQRHHALPSPPSIMSSYGKIATTRTENLIKLIDGRKKLLVQMSNDERSGDPAP